MTSSFQLTGLFLLLSFFCAALAASSDSGDVGAGKTTDGNINPVTETAAEAVESQEIIEQSLAADKKDGHQSSPLNQEKKLEVSEASRPWVPSAEKYDWVQLTSNEWLKGEIKAMYKNSLEFDSDKLDLLTIDWEDVKILRSSRETSVNIEGVGANNGIMEVTGQTVKISNDYENTEYDRSQLISFVPGGEREVDLWSIKLTLSLDLKQGNTKQFDYTAKASVKRLASRTRLVVDYIGNISKTNSGDGSLVETVNNHRVTANFDFYKTRYFFYNPIFFEYFRDPFLNIDQRLTLGTGLGYTIIDDSKSELLVSGGPAFLDTRFVSVEAGEKSKRSTAALVVRTDFDTEFSDTVDFIAKYNIQIANEDSGGFSHHAIATVESELTTRLDLDVSLIWDRVSNPTKDVNGNTPESNDYRMTVGLTYTY